MRTRPPPLWTWAALATVACALVFLQAGCRSSPSTRDAAGGEPSRVWPVPPDPPRIAFVQNITRPADVGIRPSGARRVMQWITGSDRGNERLVKPFGVALDEYDNLCITDTGANTVLFYDRIERVWKRWDRIGKMRFASPVAVAKRDGRFFVADSALGAVIVFDEAGRLAFTITNRLERPSGLAIANQKLFVADAGRHKVFSFDLRGQYQAEFGQRGTGPGEFNFPTHLSTDASHQLFVTDSLNARVQIFDGAGKFLREIGSAGDSPGHFGRPKGVGVDSHGHIYVIDALFDNVQIFDGAGRFLLTLGSAGSRAGEFWLANGVAVSRANEIYVADAYNHRVQVFKYVGQP